LSNHGSVMNTLAGIWKDALKDAHADGISVMEPACGSANDYRFIHRFGIARFLDYHGFDICAKNIANAQGMFPGVPFTVGNVLEIDRGEKCFDYCYVHDLFEHLSLDAGEFVFEKRHIKLNTAESSHSLRRDLQPKPNSHFHVPGSFRLSRQPQIPYAASIKSSHLLIISSLNNSPVKSIARIMLNSFRATATIIRHTRG